VLILIVVLAYFYLTSSTVSVASCQTQAAVINIYMMYAWLVTVERKESDAFVYTQLGKVRYTQLELRHMGFKIYTLEDYYTFVAEHQRQSMITLAQLTLDYITCLNYNSTILNR
jgi:hypothetical protein